jgi:AAA family ATP:ADP antiporter
VDAAVESADDREDAGIGVSGALQALGDVRAGERRDTATAFMTLLGVTSGHMLLETGRDALFLARLPASQLPWTYLLVAAAGVLLAKLERKIAGKTTRYAVPIALLVGAGVDVVFWALAARPAPWMLYALYVYTGVFASWVTVEFWLLLGQRFDMIAAKRLYGLIGTGSVLGAVVGALLARAVAGALPARHVLLGSAVAFAATGIGPAVAFAQRVTAGEEPAAKSIAGPSIGTELRALGNRPYIRRLLVLTLFSTLALGLVDYLFKAQAARHFAPNELASFFATVYAVLGAAGLVAQLFGVSWLLRVLGVHRGLWVVPLLVAAGATMGVVGVAMTAVLVLKGIDGSLRYSLHRTTMELLYVPLPDATRRRVKPFIDLVGQRGGQALVSLGILAAMWIGLGDSALMLGLLVMALLWLGAAIGLRTHYLDLFRTTLREGSLGAHGELPALDLDALETLFAALNSARDAEVLAALDLLAEQRRGRLIPALVLYHPSPAIVLRALDLFVREDRTDFVPIADRLVTHADLEVRTAALRARTRAKPDEAFLRAQLGSECIHVRTTALVALVSLGMDKVENLEGRVGEAAGCGNTGSVEIKRALARAVRYQPSPVFEAELEAMAESGDPRLYADVASAFGALKSERHLPLLLPMLAYRDAEPLAREAYAAVGKPAVDFLARSLDDTKVPHAIRRRIPRAMCDLDPEAVAPILVARLASEPDGMVRYRILRALGRMRRLTPRLRLDRAALTKAAEATIDDAFRALGWRIALERAAEGEPAYKTPAHELMVSLLRDKELHGTERVFRLVGLLNPGEDFARIFRGLRGVRATSTKAKASARELLENLLSRGDLRDKLLVLVDDAPGEERISRAAPKSAREGVSYEALLREILDAGGDTLRSLVAYHVGELGITALSTTIHSLRQDDVEPVMQTLIERARALLAESKPMPVTG